MDGLPDADAAAPLAAPPQKRDEWSESGIARLLEAYEAKWLLRNRAKLKWSDWVDIAREVSVHCAGDAAGKPPGGGGGGNSAKTPNQCKNKVESMKKRYRAESAAVARAGPAAGGGAGPSWRFFARMDGLLKGPPVCSAQAQVQQPGLASVIDLRAPAKPEAEVEADFATQLRDAIPVPGAFSDLMNIDANGAAAVPDKAEKVDNSVQKESRPAAAESDANVSSPRSKGADEDVEEVDKVWDRPKKRKGAEFDIAKSIELLASSFLKVERARLEMYRETERMRVEAEIKKGEMELKRTEIMAKTHLQIARLFAKKLKQSSGKNGGSSSVTAEVDTLTKKGENGSG